MTAPRTKVQFRYHVRLIFDVLTSAAMASPSDAKEEENENDETEKNKAIVGDEAEEDNFERILGDHMKR